MTLSDLHELKVRFYLIRARGLGVTIREAEQLQMNSTCPCIFSGSSNSQLESDLARFRRLTDSLVDNKRCQHGQHCLMKPEKICILGKITLLKGQTQLCLIGCNQSFGSVRSTLRFLKPSAMALLTFSSRWADRSWHFAALVSVEPEATCSSLA